MFLSAEAFVILFLAFGFAAAALLALMGVVCQGARKARRDRPS